MPRAASASSKASDWALIRKSTAISAAGVPPATSPAVAAATASASATSSGAGAHRTAAPPGRWARRVSALVADPASTALAAATTSGVER